MGSSIGKLFGVKKPPKPSPLPAPVEEVDVAGQKQYLKSRLRSKKGRKSTILAPLRGNGAGKKTVLG